MPKEGDASENPSRDWTVIESPANNRGVFCNHFIFRDA